MDTKAPGRARRAIGAAAKVLGLATTFALAAAGGALLHVGLGAPRRFVVARVNDALDGTFRGKIVIRDLGEVGFAHVGGLHVEVFDPEGQRVLLLSDARARFATVTLVESLLGKGDLRIVIPSLEVGAADVRLSQDAAGDLGIARAFEPAQPSTEPSSTATVVSIPSVRLQHVWVHGELGPSSPHLDGDLDGATGSFEMDAKTTKIAVATSVKTRGLTGRDPVGLLRANVSIPDAKDTMAELVGAVRFDGAVGAVPLVVDGAINRKRVDASVHVVGADAAAVRALAPDVVTVADDVTLHAEIHGKLPRLEPEIRASVGDATLHVRGALVIPEGSATDTHVDLQLEARDVDAAAVVSGSPKTHLSADVEAHADLHPGGKVDGSYRLRTDAGSAAGQMIPGLAFEGAFTEHGLDGSGHVAEPGAPTDVTFALRTPPGGDTPSLVDVKAVSKIDLANLKRVGAIGRGRVDAKVDAHVDLTAKTVRADASGAAWGFSSGNVSVKVAAFTASLDGAMAAPRFAVRLDGGGLAAGGYTFAGVHANVFGSPTAISVGALLQGDEANPTVDARGFVSLGRGVEVQRARVRISRGGETTTTTLRSLRVAGATMTADGLRIEGLGEPVEGSFSKVGKRLHVTAKGDDVDLAKVATLLARAEDAAGHLAFSVDLSTDGRGARGKVAAQLDRVRYRTIDGGSARVAAEIDGERVRAEVHAALGEAGRVDLPAADLQLAGPALEAASWVGATGKLALDGTVDIARLAAALPDLVAPLETAVGVVTFHATAGRERRSDLPTVEARVDTRGLALAGKQRFEKDAHGQAVLGPEPWHVEGIDAHLEARVDPAHDKGELHGGLVDAIGALVRVDVTADAPLADLLRGRATAADVVGRTKLAAHVAVPRREIDRLPPLLRQRLPLKGVVALEADLRGTARDPELVVHAKGEQLIQKNAHRKIRPADVDVEARYAKHQGDLRAAVDYDKKRVLDASAHVEGVPDFTGTSSLAADWTASADVRFSSFPLAPVSALAGQRVRGAVTGAIALRDLHRSASLGADLSFADLVLDRTKLPRGFVRVVVRDGKALAGVRLEQTDGLAEVTAKGALAWGAELTPKPQAGKGLDVHVAARNFRADAAMPFLQGIVSELDGRVDAEARAHIEPDAKIGKFDGAVVLRDGVVEIPAIGERFHGVRARVTMKPWGTLRVDDVEAYAPTGHLRASAQAKLQGYALTGASAAVHIDKGEKVPIAIEGVPMGSAYGDVKLLALLSPDGKRMNVSVDVPMLGIELPQSTGHTVQPLERDDHVRIGVHERGGFGRLALGPPEKPSDPSATQIHAAVNLGNVRVRRDTTLDVRLRGKPVFDVGETTRASGTISLGRGTLDVQGKRFTIERGTVTFLGDPAQPQIVATAHWDAPDGTRVYADFGGTPKSGKLALRSEPEHTQDEIVALVLFGSADGQLGASSGQDTSTTAKGAGLAGGVITQGVNKAISGITSADIETRVDTSEADNPRPELVVQLSQRVSAQVAYNLGVPPPGQNPDRTELTLDWRFHRGWSLDTTVGDQGSTALDLVWRLHY